MDKMSSRITLKDASFCAFTALSLPQKVISTYASGSQIELESKVGFISKHYLVELLSLLQSTVLPYDSSSIKDILYY